MGIWLWVMPLHPILVSLEKQAQRRTTNTTYSHFLCGGFILLCVCFFCFRKIFGLHRRAWLLPENDSKCFFSKPPTVSWSWSETAFIEFLLYSFAWAAGEKIAQMWWLHKVEIHSLTFLEIKSPKSWCWEGWFLLGDLREHLVHDFPWSFWGPLQSWRSMSCDHIAPILPLSSHGLRPLGGFSSVCLS